jgi:uncharacterized protein YutE (UPF0331/DUF86 family)
MNPERKKRYQDKIHYIVDNFKDLPIIPANNLEKKGIFYSIQTSIESMVDLIAMLSKDLGMQVQDDNTNINNLVENLNLAQNLGGKLTKAKGLRNILVHRYNSIDDQIIMGSINDIKALLYTWLDIIEEKLHELTKD